MVNEMLEFTEAGEVWGIGRRYALMLGRNGIKTAMQFANAPHDFVRTSMSVVGLRLQQELKGISCFAWEFELPDKKNICTGRSFGCLTTDKVLIKEAMSNFAANCALKLRQQKGAAREMKIFINTNPHPPQDKQYFRSLVIHMETATASTPEIIKYALKGFEIIFKPGYLRDFVPENEIQLNAFSPVVNPKTKKATEALDKVNRSIGKEIIRFGIQGFKKNYKARAAHLSPRYTTDVKQIIKIKN